MLYYFLMKNNPRLYIIDNFDSFTHNLIQLIDECGFHNSRTIRIDQLTQGIFQKGDRLLISPGPGLPCEFPGLHDVIRENCANLNILGICLGHQAIAEVFGATLRNLPVVNHGVICRATISKPVDALFSDILSPFEVGLYHSWTVDPENFPETLEITARSENGLILAIKHKILEVRGVQFHPESVMTPCGKKLIQNWLKNEN